MARRVGTPSSLESFDRLENGGMSDKQLVQELLVHMPVSRGQVEQELPQWIMK